FESIKVELNEDDGIHELKDKINQLISKDTLELIHLTINSQTDEITEWEKNERLAELIQLINDLQQGHIYKYKINLNTRTFFENNYFFDQLLKHMKDSTIEVTINNLLTHSQTRKQQDRFNIK